MSMSASMTAPSSIAGADAWTANIQALTRFHPHLAEAAAREESAADVEVLDGPHPTLRVRAEDGERIQMSSLYDPEEEAQRLLTGLHVEESRFIFVIGLGAGHHLEAVLARARPDACVCLIERRLPVLAAAMRIRPMVTALSDRRLRLFVGFSGDDLYSELYRHALNMANAAPCLVQHPPTLRCDPAYYEEVGAKIIGVIRVGAVEISTRVMAKNDFNLNWLENLPYTARYPGVIRLKGAFPGATAVVVSAGPSLDRSLEGLRLLQGRAIIIAVDTAVRTLLGAGVRPDLMVSVDFTPVNMKHFENVRLDGIPAVFVATTYPPCLRAHDGPKFMIDTLSPINAWFASCLGDGGQLPVGASTSHAAFSLAEYMGCATAILVGQDLAYTRGKTHADGVATQRFDEAVGARSYPVATNDGRQGATSLSLLTILRGLEDLISASSMKVINTASEGAFIRGAQVLDILEASRLVGDGDLGAGAGIARCAARPRTVLRDGLLHALHDLEGRLLRAERLSRRAIRSARRLLDRYCSEPLDMPGVQEEVAGLAAALDSLREDWRLVALLQPSLDGACIKMNWVKGGDGGSIAGDFIRSVVDERRLIEDIREACSQLRVQLRRTVLGLLDAPGAASRAAGPSELLEAMVAEYFPG
jgi:hypothetical protein